MKPTLRTRLSVVATALWIGVGAVLLGADGEDSSRISLFGTVKVDGKLLERGSVYFTLTSPSESLVTSGAYIHHGRFTLPTTDPLVPGTYQVRISGLESFLSRDMFGGDPSMPAEPLPECYNSKSVLQVVITHGGTRQLEFDLKQGK